MKHITLPKYLEKIGRNCFSGTGLEEIILPSRVREVGARAFEYCEQLKSVQLNKGLEKLGEKEATDGEECEGRVFANSGIESIRLPSSLVRVGAGTFYQCKDLRSVSITNGTEYIGKECFKESGIKRIALPSTLLEIGDNAFSGCDRLKVVWVEEDCELDVREYVGEDVEVRQM